MLRELSCAQDAPLLRVCWAQAVLVCSEQRVGTCLASGQVTPGRACAFITKHSPCLSAPSKDFCSLAPFLSLTLPRSFEACALPLLPACPPQQLSRMCWALAVLGHKPPTPWLHELLVHIRARMKAMSDR
eukprot:1149413-Pelagomonas_calceolata.AAC.10